MPDPIGTDALQSSVAHMEARTGRRDLVREGIELARSRLDADEDVVPLILMEEAGDATVEHFADGALDAARGRFAELVRSAAGSDRYALVHLGHIDRDTPAIVVEVGRTGVLQPDVFAQRFRPKGRFRGFKLIGRVEPAGKGPAIL